MLSSIPAIENLSSATKYVIAFAIIFVLLALFALILRRLTGNRGGLANERGRGRQPRLGIVDVYDLDKQRQLILLRRDNVEHLLLVGGPNDVVVETNIVRVAGARIPVATADTLDRLDGERGPGETAASRPTVDTIPARLQSSRPQEQAVVAHLGNLETAVASAALEQVVAPRRLPERSAPPPTPPARMEPAPEPKPVARPQPKPQTPPQSFPPTSPPPSTPPRANLAIQPTLSGTGERTQERGGTPPRERPLREPPAREPPAREPPAREAPPVARAVPSPAELPRVAPRAPDGAQRSPGGTAPGGTAPGGPPAGPRPEPEPRQAAATQTLSPPPVAPPPRPPVSAQPRPLPQPPVEVSPGPVPVAPRPAPLPTPTDTLETGRPVEGQAATRPDPKTDNPATRDPFSIEDIEAEFARLLGRSIDKR